MAFIFGKSIFRKKHKKQRNLPDRVQAMLSSENITTLLDVGANVGQTYDKLRSAGYKGKIVSFEPVPSAHALITQKSESDPLWVVAPRMALGAATGLLDLNVSENTDMSSLLAPTTELLETLPKTKMVEKVATNVRSLDSLYDDYCRPDDQVFLKIDTQGFERQVLNGAQETIKKIRGIQMELSLFSLYETEETYLGFLKDLHAWGFEPHLIDKTNFSQHGTRQLQIDVVFLKS